MKKDLKSKNTLLLLITIEMTTLDSQRATLIQGPEEVLHEIFINHETKLIVETSGHIYEGTKITRWIS